MPELADKLDAARAEVARLELLAASATCAEIGHDWKSLGGANCGCHEWACCSIPVNECARCKECDYGENDDARDHIAQCEHKTPEPWDDVEEGFDAGEWNNSPAVSSQEAPVMIDWGRAARELSEAWRAYADAESNLARAKADLTRAERAFDAIWQQRAESFEAELAERKDR